MNESAIIVLKTMYNYKSREWIINTFKGGAANENKMPQ